MIQSRRMKQLHYILMSIVTLFLATTIYFWISLNNLEKKHSSLSLDLNNTHVELASSTKRIASLNKTLSNTEEDLTTAQETGEALSQSLKQEQSRNEEFEEQIENITGTVGQLDKLSKIDPELLQKYSKVFFLNEHYMPEKLKEIKKTYLYHEDEPKFLQTKITSFFEDMLEDALDDDINLWIISAFRSFDEQADLKGQYSVLYGSGANTFSADQGYSEHQLGTTVDFTTNNLGGGLQGFETTPAYKWLQKNAHKYGFTLSYPEENQYYVFEPWHWRFVGTDLAKELRDNEQHFYDLDQREIDEYLISLFD